MELLLHPLWINENSVQRHFRTSQTRKTEKRKCRKPDNLQADKSETVNLCVRVPKSWRTKVKAQAIYHDLTLEKLVAFLKFGPIEKSFYF